MERRALRAAAHHLHPVVTIAQHGLTESVVREIDRSLAAHELLKVKVQGFEREDREGFLAAICEQLHCAPVQHIGNTLILWRPRPEDEAADAAEAKARPRGPRVTKKQAGDGVKKPRRRRLSPR